MYNVGICVRTRDPLPRDFPMPILNYYPRVCTAISEEPLALEIINVLKSHGVGNATYKPLEQSASARLWHYEIWFSREALR